MFTDALVQSNKAIILLSTNLVSIIYGTSAQKKLHSPASPTCKDPSEMITFLWLCRQWVTGDFHSRPVCSHRADDMDALACPIASCLLALAELVAFPVTAQLLPSSALHMWTTVNLNQLQQNIKRDTLDSHMWRDRIWPVWPTAPMP